MGIPANKLSDRRERADPKAILPANTPALGLNRAQAAAYVGISPSLFDRAVKDGQMPRPRQCYGRCVWDRNELDQYFSLWPHGGGAETETADEKNPWG